MSPDRKNTRSLRGKVMAKYEDPTKFNFNDAKNLQHIKSILQGSQDRTTSYPYSEYDETLKIVNPRTRGNEVISYSLLQYDDRVGSWYHCTDSSCNEVLSSHFFRDILPENVSQKRDFFYLSIFANPLFHDHIIASIHRYFKIVLGSEFVPVERIPIEYTKETIEKHCDNVNNFYSDWFYDKESMEAVVAKINKINYGFMYPIKLITSGRGVSKENRAEFALKSLMIIKIPMIYGYSTLSLYTLGISAKVGQFLNHEKPFEEAFLEFSTKTYKMPYIFGSEPVRRWKNMEEVLKKVRNLKFMDVFPSYAQSKQQSAGYDTVKRHINALNLAIRRSPDNITNRTDGRTVFMELDELTRITNHVKMEYLSALVTKPVAAKLVDYLNHAVKLMDGIKKDLEKILRPVRKPKAPKVVA